MEGDALVSTCRHCNGPLPPSRNRKRIYCSKSCKDKFASRKWRADPSGRGALYFLVNPAWPGCVKVGRTGNANKRLSDYTVGDPYGRYEYYAVINVENPKHAEACAHRALRQYRRLNGEWFAVDPAVAVRLVQSALRRELGECLEDEVRDLVSHGSRGGNLWSKLKTSLWSAR